jgi:hypothetical protein
MPPSEPLTDFIARCDPGAPVALDCYVERPQPVTKRLRDQLSTGRTSRVLLLGPSGVGKTTELARFARETASAYKVIRPPIETHLDLSIASWHDLFIFSVLWEAEQSGLTELKHARELDDALRPPEPRTAGFIEEGPPPTTATQRFRNDHGRVQKALALAPAQCWDFALSLLEQIEKKEGKTALLLLDGLEKMGPDAAKQLYYHDGRYLRQLPCRAIVTAPLAMSFEPYFGDIEESFFMVERLRAFVVADSAPGREFFRELAAKRQAEAVMTPELIEEAISWGGGLPRQFCQLLTAAATQALMERRERVDAEALVRARLRITERWQYQLEPKDITALGLLDTKRERADRARLLRLGALFEYEQQDGTMKLEPNPLVAALLERRIHEELRGRG